MVLSPTLGVRTDRTLIDLDERRVILTVGAIVLGTIVQLHGSSIPADADDARGNWRVLSLRLDRYADRYSL